MAPMARGNIGPGGKSGFGKARERTKGGEIEDFGPFG